MTSNGFCDGPLLACRITEFASGEGCASAIALEGISILDNLPALRHVPKFISRSNDVIRQ